MYEYACNTVDGLLITFNNSKSSPKKPWKYKNVMDEVGEYNTLQSLW